MACVFIWFKSKNTPVLKRQVPEDYTSKVIDTSINSLWMSELFSVD